MRSRLQLGIAVAIILASAAAFSGCGVRGSLEAPPGAANESGGATPGKPGEPVPHKPSVLDPLIR